MILGFIFNNFDDNRAYKISCPNADIFKLNNFRKFLNSLMKNNQMKDWHTDEENYLDVIFSKSSEDTLKSLASLRKNY